MRTKMKKATITLKYGELLYDIQNKTYVRGRSKADGGDGGKAADMQADESEECANEIRRGIMHAAADIRGALAKWLADERDAFSDTLDGGGDIVLALNMHDNWNAALGATLCSEMHRYVVAKAVGCWFALTNAEEAARWEAAAAQSMERIEAEANRHAGRVRRAQSPF